MTATDGDDLVWYAAYGSNLSLERFHCYVAGGRPPGGRHTYPGCRDASPPREPIGRSSPRVPCTSPRRARSGAAAWRSTTRRDPDRHSCAATC
ncbi:hypothetical protein BN12_90013 [Nostocoides japonicum T1-X7]|uniref:Histone deacetylase n=1 Tax=Nostocoides japonicum T1-X7 TaxID=1194083 RepID=A0A077M1Y8_9MICO|nr:hypothetical protein BN12_90013 [Tetrasphaera japonica T1-X7]